MHGNRIGEDGLEVFWEFFLTNFLFLSFQSSTQVCQLHGTEKSNTFLSQ